MQDTISAEERKEKIQVGQKQVLRDGEIIKKILKKGEPSLLYGNIQPFEPDLSSFLRP